MGRSKNTKNNTICPYCHVIQETDLIWEVIFDNFTLSFKCQNCKKDVRIYLKMIDYGELENG